MKRQSLILVAVILFTRTMAGITDSVKIYSLSDTVKPVLFVSTIRLSESEGRKKATAGIRTSEVSLFLESGKKRQSVVFMSPKGSNIVTTGLDVKTDKKGRMAWAYPWSGGEDYKLYIASAGDSAGNFILYSGYIYLPKENKWKLIGTCKISGQWGTMSGLQSFSNAEKGELSSTVSAEWVQRNNGRWFNLNNDASVAPVLMPFPSIDSVRQSMVDQGIIAKSLNNEKSDPPKAKEGIYYWILKEGTGRELRVTDTVTVFYKGYIFTNGTIFDQTEKEPRTFPLSRLIKGWQSGLAGIKTGTKVKLLIPSGQAYWIRTRGAKIPPNSILVFEIEVVNSIPVIPD